MNKLFHFESKSCHLHNLHRPFQRWFWQIHNRKNSIEKFLEFQNLKSVILETDYLNPKQPAYFIPPKIIENSDREEHSFPIQSTLPLKYPSSAASQQSQTQSIDPYYVLGRVHRNLRS
jgi:hypothetical protein